jgi:3-phosphoshikimate 1-carboxyvinyltransferase
VAVPGSKSIANRALVCAALAEGRTTVTNLPDGDDTMAMVTALGTLGLRVVHDVLGATVVVDGGVAAMAADDVHLDARLAGTTSRFLTALAAVSPATVVVDGGEPLRRRPMGPLHDALTALGAIVEPLGAPGHLPVRVRRATGLRSADVAMPGDVSSQFLTALMLIGPLLPGGLVVRLTTPLVSRPYVAITAAVMAAFGVEGVEVDERHVRVPPGRYTARRYDIEPDASSASYPLAAAAMVGGRVTVPGLGSESLQGDARFAELLAEMGCSLDRDRSSTTIVGRPALRGLDVHMADLSDLVPTLAVVATAATSPTRVRDVGFIRHKESDRIGDLAGGLRAAGIEAIEHDDGLEVHPGVPRAARLATHHDHRLAMSFALLGLRSAGIEISDPDVVTKSWPGFWQSLESW